MARKQEVLHKKITKEGWEITLLDNTLIKKYHRTYICMMSFSTHKEAKKEYNKFRQGNKIL